MANTNDMNTPTKVPCGGFVLGEGLALSKDGKTLNVTGGGSSQANWNQNDETAVDYVKNRPGGYDAETPTKTYNCVTTVGTNPFDMQRWDSEVHQSTGHSQNSCQKIEQYFEVFLGEERSIIFDGTEYRSIITKEYDSSVYADVYHFGDSEFTDIPFHIYAYWDVEFHEYRAFIGLQDSSVSHTVDITTYIKTPVVFNKKYLPDLKTLTNTQSYDKNSYLVCDENSRVRWEAIDSPNSLIAPKSYVDARITKKEIILESSTGGSSKKFKITVDDTGTIKATEVTNN